MAKIYTKTGDQGSTGLFGGPRVRKFDSRLEAYGTLDELNAVLGWARSMATSGQGARLTELDGWLANVQNHLFNMGSHLALGDPSLRDQLPRLTQTPIEQLERAIDRMSEELPALTQFILPGGTPTSSALHMARTVSRRAERRVARLEEKHGPDPLVLIYLNRLSDFLFVAARYANFVAHVPDVAWQKPAES